MLTLKMYCNECNHEDIHNLSAYAFLHPGDQLLQGGVQTEHAAHHRLPEGAILLQGRRSAGSLLRGELSIAFNVVSWRRTLLMTIKLTQRPLLFHSLMSACSAAF